MLFLCAAQRTSHCGQWRCTGLKTTQVHRVKEGDCESLHLASVHWRRRHYCGRTVVLRSAPETLIVQLGSVIVFNSRKQLNSFVLSGYLVYHWTVLRSAHTVYLCVLCGSQNKQPLFPYTTLTDWFLYQRFNPLKPSGHYTSMYRQFNIQQFYVLPTHCIYVFCVDLRTNSHYFPIQH